ncbi:MAG TPA: hypothetical protein VFN10_08860 [Thermoanaerobaculia bacterium]|nr:hypothetical protein [Thermoanaerobaculia bacterium]
MTGRLQRLFAIIRADFLIRLRRPSTVVVFLLLSAMPYLWIPDPSTGKALIQLMGRRALYNSAALGMATALIATIFVSLFGFYVISNALRRDIQTRCGYVIASTTMRGSEYIAGKFAGNVVFLTVFMTGFMIASMVMQLVRGEAPLEPFTFAKQYLLLVPPSIVFVSALAIFFECTPLLRGKFGDVLYFFLWVGAQGVITYKLETSNGHSWAQYFDTSGLGFVLLQMKTYYHSTSLAIGSTNFDAKLAPIVFTGLRAAPSLLLPRIVATIWPIALLVLARLFFHRFDPARVRAAAAAARKSWMGRFNAIAKPLARLVTSAIAGGRSNSLLGSARADAATTLAAMPLSVFAIIGVAIAALTSTKLFHGVMPIAFAVVAIVIADISCREKRAGTSALIYAAPSLRTNFVLWKFITTFAVAMLFLVVPFARAATTRPASLLALLIGLAFTCAAATTLGTLSANPKTFLVGFLSFWYIVTQDRGASPAMDFAGWYTTPAPAVLASYALASLALLAAAHAFHLRELRRRW